MPKLGLILIVAGIISSLLLPGFESIAAKDVVRPEKVVSKRLVMHDQETYGELAQLWKEYYDAFPSEEAYGNWMYAARYAGQPDYQELLAKGQSKYSANPVLLYLTGLQKHGAADNSVGRDYLERAAALDPTYMDPWFALVVHYMNQNDDELLNLALRRLLEGGAVSDVVMDYSYNMLAGLDMNAVIITNGDNDTYPGLILQHLLDFRPDVTIVNRSLLNTEWYPGYLMENGMVSFISQVELTELREQIRGELKAGGQFDPAAGPFGDPLVARILTAANGVERSVYFSWTLKITEAIDEYMEQGRPLGLANLVTSPRRDHAADLQKVLAIWLEDFRTGGLDSWQLHYAKPSDTGLSLAWNYAGAVHRMMDGISKFTPVYRLPLFIWSHEHITDLLPQNMNAGMAQLWCQWGDVPPIAEWCLQRGLME